MRKGYGDQTTSNPTPMTDFENEQYDELASQRNEAIALFKSILKIMKSDQREGDRYVYDEEKKIKDFIAKCNQ